MIKHLCNLTVASLLAMANTNPAQAQEIRDPVVRELLAMDLTALGSVQVYTASRELAPLDEAPAIVTVITTEEIRRRGHRNLADVLNRVPGFISYADSFTHIFGHRGFMEDAMSHYLFMIDGHKLNNQMWHIGNQEHLLPRLSHIKRIEIIRSPGSTLWGADAAAGIIHFITYDGKDLDEDGEGSWQISADWEFENKRRMGNLLYGIDLGEANDLMVSLNYSKSEGDWSPAYHADNDGYVLWPDARPWNKRWNLSDTYGPNHELYLKYRHNDITVIARYSKSRPSRFQRSDRDTDTVEQWPRLHWSTDLRYAPRFSDELQLETSLFFDHHEVDHTWSTSDTVISEYDNYGASAILTHATDAHRIKAGMDTELRDWSSNAPMFDNFNGLKDEHIWGIFVEENYFGIEDWSFTAGLRYDYNDLRSSGGGFSPRASVFHRLDDRWSLKYTYNTGEVRPSIRKYRRFTDEDTFTDIQGGAPWVGVEHPQTSEAHDLQLSYRDDRASLSLTLFDMTIEDYATYIGYTAFGHPDPALYGYEYIDQNLGDLNSRGIELEGSYTYSSDINFYGNATYSRTKLSDRFITMRGGLHRVDIVAEPDMDLVNYDLEKTGWPKFIWNLGVDLEPVAGHQFNIHYRGWAKNPIKAERQPNEFDEFGPEHFVDVNYGTTAFGRGIELSVYMKNIFNNEAKYSSPNDGGYTVNDGRTLGVSGKLVF